MTDVDVAIVGGGISGLSIAWYLARAGLSVELWEAGERPGGKIGTDRRNGYVTERAASMVLNYLPEFSRFLDDTGLAAQTLACPRKTNRYLYNSGALDPVAMTLSGLIRSPLWSRRAKLRLLAEPFMPKGRDPDESVTQFVTRRLGREFLEKAFEPFIGATLASDPDFANARATLPRLTALEQRFGSFALGLLARKVLGRGTVPKEQTFSFAGGMSRLVEVLSSTPGIRLRTGHRATALLGRGDGWRIWGQSLGGERAVDAGCVVLAVPADIATSLVAPFDGELGETLSGIAYAPVSVVHMGFARGAIGHPLDGNGFLVPRREGTAITGCLWMSSLFPERAPAGKALLTCYVGGARNPQAIDWNDRRLADEALAALQVPLELRGHPEMIRINRHRAGLPLYYGAYHARVATLDARLKRHRGLYLEANYRGGVSVRDRVARAGMVARNILSQRRARDGGHRGPVAVGPAISAAGAVARAAMMTD